MKRITTTHPSKAGALRRGLGRNEVEYGLGRSEGLAEWDAERKPVPELAGRCGGTAGAQFDAQEDCSSGGNAGGIGTAGPAKPFFKREKKTRHGARRPLHAGDPPGKPPGQ